MINNKEHQLEQNKNLNISFIAIMIPTILAVIAYIFLFTITKTQSIGYSFINLLNIINKFATMFLLLLQVYLLFTASSLIKDNNQKILNVIYSVLGIISILSISGVYTAIYLNGNVQKLMSASNNDKMNHFIYVTIIIIGIFLVLNLIGNTLFILGNTMNKNKLNIISIISFIVLFLLQLGFNFYWIYSLKIFQTIGINQIASYLVVSLPWNFLILAILLMSTMEKEKILYIGIIIISLIEMLTSIFKLITGNFSMLINMFNSSLPNIFMAIFSIIIFIGIISIYTLIIISSSNSIIRKNKDVHSS